MSVCVSSSPLIIGIGNPLRGDDGLGWAVIEYLSQEGCPDCELRVVQQLTPELACAIHQADLVVLIDACCESEPGTLALSLVQQGGQPDPISSHYATPHELAGLTRTLYGSCPPVVVVSVSGAHFGLGEQLSPAIAARIATVSEVVKRFVKREEPC